MAGEFTCACCGCPTENEVDEEEALAEYKKVFGDEAQQNLVAVCDECYGVLMSDNPHDEVAKLVRSITGQD